MRRPGLGEASQGALAGAVVGAIGGLFAVGLAPAIIGKDLTLLFKFPLLSLLCWLVSLPAGWFIGGQVGPPLGELLNSPRAEVVGGAIGGLVPVLGIALWGWYMITPH
jgi:hypothetical protein